jgi:hypothetical protein
MASSTSDTTEKDDAKDDAASDGHHGGHSAADECEYGPPGGEFNNRVWGVDRSFHPDLVEVR